MRTAQRRATAAQRAAAAKARRARESVRPPPLSFRAFVDIVTGGRFQWYTHTVRLAAVLQRVADDELRRVMVFMPPRHGKSEEVSRLFSAYYLYRHPDRWVGINSYAAELAYTLSRAARENFTRGGGVLRDDAYAVKHWETAAGGGLWAAGVGGPITGKGFHLGIIDDPLKNAEEAASETIRAKQEEWYGSTFYTREEPGGAIVIVQTRWHEDDLSGKRLADEADEMPEGWHVVSFEAVKEEEPQTFPASCTVEPDWREPGEPLCPERASLERLKKIARRIGSYFWNALFQQRPRPKAGDRFKREWFPIVKAAPAGGRDVRYWDKAATEGAGDWTAGVRMRRVGDLYYVVDVVRGQWSSGQRDAVIRQTAAMDGPEVAVWGEQEPGASGKDAAAAFVRMLSGFNVHTEPATGSKEVRADPFAAQAEAGNVFMLEGEWNRAFLDELTEFPRGKHDDQVDGATGAFNRLAVDPTRVIRRPTITYRTG